MQFSETGLTRDFINFFSKVFSQAGKTIRTENKITTKQNY